MMPITVSAGEVVASFDRCFRSTQLISLGSAGGFSGAHLFQVGSDIGNLCLRCWPPGTEKKMVKQVHDVLTHAASRGIDFIPVPFRSNRGATIVEHSERWWEVAPWMPGNANFHQDPSMAKLVAALTALGHLHVAMSDFESRTLGVGISPGLQRRQDQLEVFLRTDCQRLQAALPNVRWPDFVRRAERQLALFSTCAIPVARSLSTTQDLIVPLQWCVRDVWHDHVLFAGEEVVGLVDFGALRVESVVGDIARLLGSLVGDDVQAWQVGLEAYESVSPLSSTERRLLRAFDRSSVLLSGMNWLRWICFEGRRFDDSQAVLLRLDDILQRLSKLEGQLNAEK